MEDLSSIVGGVQTAEAEAQAAAQQTKDAAVTKLEAMQRNISIATETTGSPLHDGIIVLYGPDLIRYPQIATNYEETAEKLMGKAGEPVVLVNRWRKRTGRIGRRVEPQYMITDSVSVGVLDEEELKFDYDENACYLPTSQYARLSRRHESEIQISEGALIVSSRLSTFRHMVDGQFDLGYDLHEPVSQD